MIARQKKEEKEVNVTTIVLMTKLKCFMIVFLLQLLNR